jgi:hypothetical protein
MTHTLSELVRRFEQISDIPQQGTYWKHYKGDIYVVICICIIESTEELGVCYQSYSNSLKYPWFRSLKEWNETIIHNNLKVNRFVPCDIQNVNCPPLRGLMDLSPDTF